MKKRFGSQASYLVDFYHVCEYLGGASKICAANDEKNWMDVQEKRLKNNEHSLVIHDLNPFLEAIPSPK